MLGLALTATLPAFLKRAIRNLPYFTLLTGALYAAGQEFHSGYWRGVGLPLMSVDESVASLLYQGSIAYFLLLGEVLKFITKFVVVGVLLLPVVGFALHFKDDFETRVNTMLFSQTNRAFSAFRERRLPSASIVDALSSSERFTTNAMRYVAVSVATLAAILMAFALAVLAGKQGFEQGRAAVRSGMAHLMEENDALVDVTVVDIRSLLNERIERAVPLTCAGDRCAAITSAGPISLPKDRFLGESVVKAVWDDTCRRAPLRQ